ncbi:MAG: ABC transporter permease, partial [Erysipelotrichaceae bacterium]
SDTNSVGQNIDGLYDKFLKDYRIEHVVFMDVLNEQKITIDDKTYNVIGTNMAPMMNKLVAGRMANGDGYEVVLAEAFVQKTGLSNDEIIGKEIMFDGKVIDNQGENVTYDPISIKVKVVGVADTTQTTEEGGEIFSFNFEDAHFFSYNALKDMRAQAGMSMDDTPFIIRTKDAKVMIEIKDELMQKGIVPLGRFQLIEGIIRLDNMSEEQSSSAYILIGVLAIFASLAVSLITGFMRKNEYAIYKINGYSNSKLCGLIFMEYMSIAFRILVTLGILGIAYNILLNIVISTTFVNTKIALLAIGSVLFVTLLCAFATTIVACTTDEMKSLKTGDR